MNEAPGGSLSRGGAIVYSMDAIHADSVFAGHRHVLHFQAGSSAIHGEKRQLHCFRPTCSAPVPRGPASSKTDSCIRQAEPCRDVSHVHHACGHVQGSGCSDMILFSSTMGTTAASIAIFGSNRC